jgi:hypothetical protein
LLHRLAEEPNYHILLYKSQQDAQVTEFILSDNCCTCFGRYYHPSLGHKTTVTTASGNRYTLIDKVKFTKKVYLKKKKKTDQDANHNTLKSIPTLPQ